MLPVDKPLCILNQMEKNLSFTCKCTDLIHYAANDDFIIAELQLDPFSFHNQAKNECKFAVYHLAIRFLSFLNIYSNCLKSPSAHISINNPPQISVILLNILTEAGIAALLHENLIQNGSTSRLTFMNPCIKDAPLH